MTDTVELRQFLIILIAAVTVVSLFRRLRGSSVLGYLLAGALIGPFGLGLIHDIESTDGVARLGVVFLLFWIGLELSVERILALRRYVFGLGAAQVLVTTLVFWAALRVAGLGNGAALIIGAGLSLSSTAVVLRMLVERRELLSSRAHCLRSAAVPGSGRGAAAHSDTPPGRERCPDSAGARQRFREDGHRLHRHPRSGPAGAPAGAASRGSRRYARAVHRYRAAGGAWGRLDNRAVWPSHGARSLPGRAADGGDRVPTPDRGRHPAVPRASCWRCFS